VSGEPSAAEALAAFRDANGLRHDERHAPLWEIRIGRFAMMMPNFAWRRRAIDAHDLHHLLTGYPCTVKGELEIAAWEFGAGRYPHWGATLFCGPLVLAGLAAMPRRTIAAFRRGRRGRSLYRDGLSDRLSALPLAAARAAVEGREV
jgi:hypothetical protein